MRLMEQTLSRWSSDLTKEYVDGREKFGGARKMEDCKAQVRFFFYILHQDLVSHIQSHLSVSPGEDFSESEIQPVKALRSRSVPDRA